MNRRTFENLGELRERLVNLRAATVAELAGIPRERLRVIEEGAPPSVFEIERLAAVYGLDADALWDDPIQLDESDAAFVLASQEEFRGVSDTTRARMLRAATAARDLCTLRRLLGDTVEPLPKLQSPARLCLRKELGVMLPSEPPASLRALTADPALDRDERPRSVDDLPLSEIPFERRGVLAEAAVRAWSRGLLTRDACARFLGVTPGSEIERVADYFGEDLPHEQTLAG